jgi:hypothetical protein
LKRGRKARWVGFPSAKVLMNGEKMCVFIALEALHALTHARGQNCGAAHMATLNKTNIVDDNSYQEGRRVRP